MMNEVISLGGQPVQGFGIGAVERRNPLPVGRYWIDIFDSQENAFRAWLNEHKGSVRVITTESYPSSTFGGYEGRVWRLFEVTAPVSWNGPGFPTIAEAHVKGSDDTAQRPPKEKDPLDRLGEIEVPVSGLRTVSWVLGGVVLVAAVVVGGVILIKTRSATPRREKETSSGQAQPDPAE